MNVFKYIKGRRLDNIYNTQFLLNPRPLTWFFCCVTVGLTHRYTSSSAAAERPRDVSCLSVFNSILHRAQFSVIGYIGFRFTTACN